MGNTYDIARYGFNYRITVDDPIMEDRYTAGELCEQGMLDWIVANIPHGGIWVDAGANVGNHTLVFATACKADHVFAFEPVPCNYDNLRANIATTKNVFAVPLGVGQGPGLMGITATAQGRNCQFALAEGPWLDAALVSLDAVVPHAVVRLLKIDVEGMEIEVLQGARNIILKSQPEIFVEVWKQVDLDWIRTWLAQRGYELIECYGHAPTFHFSASGRYPVTYKPRQLQ